MEVTLAVLADAANVSADGKLNLLGVFQTISAVEAPVKYPLFSIIVTLRADSGEKGIRHTVGIDLTDEDMRDIHKIDTLSIVTPTDTKMPFAEINLIYAIKGLRFPTFGQYQFHVIINETRMRTIDFFVQPVILPKAVAA